MGKNNFSSLILVLAVLGILAVFSGCLGSSQQGTPNPTPEPTSEVTDLETPPETTISTPGEEELPASTPIPTPTPVITSSTDSVTPPKITISSPGEGDQVSLRQTVEGTSTGIYGTDYGIYVLVYPNATETDLLWEVQPKVDISPNGNWNTNAYFGDPANPANDTGKHFKIAAIVSSAMMENGSLFAEIPDVVYRANINDVVRK